MPEQRLHEFKIAVLFLLNHRLGVPGVGRPLHVDGGIQRREPLHRGEVRIGAVFQQECRNVEVAVGNRHHHGRNFFRSAETIDVGARFHQRTHGLERTIARGIEKRRCAAGEVGSELSPGRLRSRRVGGWRSLGRRCAGVGFKRNSFHRSDFGRGVGIGAPGYQCADSRAPVLCRGEHQRRLFPGQFFGVHVSAVFQQSLDGIHAARRGCHHQRCNAGVACRVDIGSGGGQHFHHGAAAGLRSQKNRCNGTHSREGFRIRALCQQRFSHRPVITRGSPVQRGHSIALGRVHVRLFRQQRSDRCHLAGLRGIGHGSGTRRAQTHRQRKQNCRGRTH